ncbi:Flap endonuclease Xni [subsurface metagenome]
MLKSAEGVKTGLFHGFLYLVLSLKDMYLSKPIVAWEGGDLVRKKKMIGYKANRAAKPDDFVNSVIVLKELLALMGIKQKYAPGYEADDVAAVFCKKYKDEKIMLVSEDSDWLQSINENCVIYKNGKEWTYEDLKKSNGFSPEKILLYKILTGNAKDNVSGIPYFPTQLAKQIVNKCNYLGDVYHFKTGNRKYLKWLYTLKNNKELLTFNYEILKLNANVELEDLPCHEKKNISKLKEQLIEMQLFKVLNMMKRIL